MSLRQDVRFSLINFTVDRTFFEDRIRTLSSVGLWIQYRSMPEISLCFSAESPVFLTVRFLSPVTTKMPLWGHCWAFYLLYLSHPGFCTSGEFSLRCGTALHLLEDCCLIFFEGQGCPRTVSIRSSALTLTL